MAKEINQLSSVEKEKIGPDLTEEQIQRHERESGLSQLIKKWWQGDIHTHSFKSTRPEYDHFEGLYNISEAADYYSALDLNFVAIAEHSSDPSNPEVLTIEHPICQSLLAEAEEIHQGNQEGHYPIPVYAACAVNILFDNQDQPVLDLPDEVLKKLDLVIASRHKIEQEKDKQFIQSSLLSAIKNPNVDVIGHPDRGINIDRQWNLLPANDSVAAEFEKQRLYLENLWQAESDPEKKQLMEQNLREHFWNIIEKVIGKLALDNQDQSNEQLMRFREKFKEIINAQEDYWQIWPPIIQAMKEQNKAFEINLKEPPAEKLVEMAALAGLYFSINFDAHDFSQFKKYQKVDDQTKLANQAKTDWAKGERSNQIEEILYLYKEKKLSGGPGFHTLRLLIRWLKKLESLGVKPAQVINSSRENLENFLYNVRAKSVK